MILRLLFCCVALALASCAQEHEQVPKPQFHETQNPQHLSDWGQLGVNGDYLTLGERVTPYQLATPLFSDYAQKLRTVWLPEGEPAVYSENEVFSFPVGTVISKTFYYENADGTDEWNEHVRQTTNITAINGQMPMRGIRLIETRLLVHRQSGWEALPYIWNEDQTDATLTRIGDIKRLTLVSDDGTTSPFAYSVPNVNQCAGCHATNATTRAIKPIGPKARHLNIAFGDETNQLNAWSNAGLLTQLPRLDDVSANVDWNDLSAPLDARARSYLDINCSHCHNPNGAADTSGLNLEPDADGPALGICKLPIAAGGGTGGRTYGLVPGAPEASILLYRMQTRDPGAMMPELGRSLTHDDGIALIAEWINHLSGTCS